MTIAGLWTDQQRRAMGRVMLRRLWLSNREYYWFGWFVIAVLTLVLIPVAAEEAYFWLTAVSLLMVWLFFLHGADDEQKKGHLLLRRLPVEPEDLLWVRMGFVFLWLVSWALPALLLGIIGLGVAKASWVFLWVAPLLLGFAAYAGIWHARHGKGDPTKSSHFSLLALGVALLFGWGLAPVLGIVLIIGLFCLIEAFARQAQLEIFHGQAFQHWPDEIPDPLLLALVGLNSGAPSRWSTIFIGLWLISDVASSWSRWRGQHPPRWRWAPRLGIAFTALLVTLATGWSTLGWQTLGWPTLGWSAPWASWPKSVTHPEDLMVSVTLWTAVGTSIVLGIWLIPIEDRWRRRKAVLNRLPVARSWRRRQWMIESRRPLIVVPLLGLGVLLLSRWFIYEVLAR